jgi:hypothetical protein
MPTTIEPPTTPEVTSNLIRYSTQPQTTILNHNKLNSFPTFPARSTGPGRPCFQHQTNISNISLKEEKSSLTELQQTFKRTYYNKLMKIMS